MIREVIVLEEAADDLERGRAFYDRQEEGVGQYFIHALLADIERLALFHGIHRVQHGCFRMLAARFPYGIYYLDTETQTQVVAVLDLRRNPSWISKQMMRRLHR
jgi:plasmid stabilization system protein ParE